MNRSRRQGHYGIDAPYAPFFMGIGLLGCLGLVVFAHLHAFLYSAFFLAFILALYLHTSLRGKFAAWRDVLNALVWRGDEQVLDLGCGRGAVLLMVAEYIPRGRVTGIDIWSSKDQSGNGIEVTAANAEIEGVADRVELKTADMRELPFADASFDVVVSNVAIHNINNAEGRDQAIDEAWRVLRPGGRLLIADISKTRDYQRRLAALGIRAERRSLGWRMWWGAPWMSTMLLSVDKPTEEMSQSDS